jgi:hypothetical protein
VCAVRHHLGTELARVNPPTPTSEVLKVLIESSGRRCGIVHLDDPPVLQTANTHGGGRVRDSANGAQPLTGSAGPPPTPARASSPSRVPFIDVVHAPDAEQLGEPAQAVRLRHADSLDVVGPLASGGGGPLRGRATVGLRRGRPAALRPTRPAVPRIQPPRRSRARSPEEHVQQHDGDDGDDH